MGVNDPNTFDKSEVDNYTDQVNSAHQTHGEKILLERTRALTGTMNPMPGVKDQEISVMGLPQGEADKLREHTLDLSRQSDAPMKALDIGTFTGYSAGAIA